MPNIIRQFDADVEFIREVTPPGMYEVRAYDRLGPKALSSIFLQMADRNLSPLIGERLRITVENYRTSPAEEE